MLAPLQLHPLNPRYFLYDGRALALVTSTEHFGGLINLDFDYRTYLHTLAHSNFTLSQTWTGAYVEPDSDVGPYNTLDPRNGRLIAPWARSDVPGNAKGGTKFDLRQYNETFFSRLIDFVDTARELGIVVEVGLFGGYEQTHESIWRGTFSRIESIASAPWGVVCLRLLLLTSRVTRRSVPLPSIQQHQRGRGQRQPFDSVLARGALQLAHVSDRDRAAHRDGAARSPQRVLSGVLLRTRLHSTADL
jgi:hypothetical protein